MSTTRSGGVVTVYAMASGYRAVRPMGLRVGASIGRWKLYDEGTAREIRTATVTVDSAVVRGALLRLAGSTWLEGLRPTQVGGFLSAERRSGHDGRLWARASRSPIWRSADGTDPLRAIRVRDLRRLDRGIGAVDVRLGVDAHRVDDPFAVTLEIGATRYDDGNRRALGAARVRILASDGPTLSLTVEPNVYVETFAGSTPGFLTPTGFGQVGIAARARARIGPLSIAAVINPSVSRDASQASVGVDGNFGASILAGGGTLGISTDFMRHGSYRFLQVKAGVGFGLR